ncbi:MAG: exonuclease SbcCD subunit D [Clostridia bacterium]|nr:exonuclease SbcCD subunit D [Clostridia bacterium]MBQ2326139.1 exonuclease SbcCD subunit D [Clostridia bacterium]
MKLIHLSDLHIGKRLNEFSMLEDQIYILNKIVDIIDSEQPDAVLIAGDVYDKAVPSAEAVQVFDDFLYRLAAKKQQVFVISGNHDSPERIAFGGRLMDRSGIYMSPVYHGEIAPVVLKDEYGEADIYMLPFIKPAHVRRYYPDAEIESYTDAIGLALGDAGKDRSRRSVLVTHQFVTGAMRSESEEISVGGSDNVDVTVFDGFDYVALGHIHGPQAIARETVRYCGTPLKYSFSEMDHVKSVTVVELREKGDVEIRTVPLMPMRDLREIRGRFDELTAKDFCSGIKNDDYFHIILTDEEDIPNALGRLRVIYPNLMKLDYDNKRTRHNNKIDSAEAVETKSPIELFGELYEKQNNQPMSDEQTEYILRLIEDIWEVKE